MLPLQSTKFQGLGGTNDVGAKGGSHLTLRGGGVQKGFHAEEALRKRSGGGVQAPRYHWSDVVEYHVGWVMSGMWTLGG